MVLGALVQQLGRQGVLDDQLHHGFLQVFLRHFRVVLGRQHHGVDTDYLAVFVAAGDLRLGIRAQPRQQAGLARFGLALDQTVREADRCRHQHFGFVAGITEHQALVTGAWSSGLERSTPWAMSTDCLPMMFITAQVAPSKPTSELL